MAHIGLRLACLVLVSLAFFHGVCAKSVENLEIKCNSDGTFTVYLSGNIWFRSGAVGVRADSRWWATDEKTLEITGQTTDQGRDMIGDFTLYEYTWKAVSNASAVDLQVNTYINVYVDVPVVVFAIAYITAANNTAIPEVYNRTVSSFPSFIIEETQVKRGYTTWAGNSKTFRVVLALLNNSTPTLFPSICVLI